MSTNFYVEVDKEKLHIGKSAAGWYFLLHVIPERNINSLEDWKPLFLNGDIFDEYHRKITKSMMLGIISERSFLAKRDYPNPLYSSQEEFNNYNLCEDGVNNLKRPDISRDKNCIGHGEGPWSYIIGEFS